MIKEIKDYFGIVILSEDNSEMIMTADGFLSMQKPIDKENDDSDVNVKMILL